MVTPLQSTRSFSCKATSQKTRSNIKQRKTIKSWLHPKTLLGTFPPPHPKKNVPALQLQPSYMRQHVLQRQVVFPSLRLRLAHIQDLMSGQRFGVHSKVPRQRLIQGMPSVEIHQLGPKNSTLNLTTTLLPLKLAKHD